MCGELRGIFGADQWPLLGRELSAGRSHLPLLSRKVTDLAEQNRTKQMRREFDATNELSTAHPKCLATR